MPNARAIPQGYMTVGEAAKKMGVTVRTLQYYDKEGLLTPSAESEGGRRLYTHRDVVRLHQILSLKHLGFSLDDIKNRLSRLDSPEEVAEALTEQAAIIRQKIESLSESLREIEMLRTEVIQMQSVNFKKYADIIVNLQMKNEFYWLIKHFDDETLDYIRGRFDQESGLAMIRTFQSLQEKALLLREAGAAPESEQGIELARAFWHMVMEFTNGDMSMLPQLMKIGSFVGVNSEWRQRQAQANSFIEPALGAYFEREGIQPFAEEGS